MKWQPIETAPSERDMRGLFPVVVANIYYPEDGPPEVAWAHTAYRTMDGEWMANTAGLKMHGNASFYIGRPTHWMPLPEPPQ